MKPLILHSLSPKRLAVICIVTFMLASALVGYTTQLQSSPVPSAGSSPGGYGVGNGTVVPIAMQPVTLFATTASTGTAPSGSYSTSFGGRMVELNAYLTIQVDNLKVASDQATQLASLFNGYVASSSFDDSGSSANIVLSIPEANFSSAMRNLSNLGTVKAQSISSNDVTEQYVNLQAQLNSYTTEESTLLRILNSSTTVTDALNTENAIQNTQAQINDLEGQLRVMQGLVTFGTINIQFIQPAKNPTLDFGDAFTSALVAFYTVTRGMLILGASIVPVAMVGSVVYVPYRHFSRKRLKPVEAK